LILFKVKKGYKIVVAQFIGLLNTFFHFVSGGENLMEFHYFLPVFLKTYLHLRSV